MKPHILDIPVFTQRRSSGRQVVPVCNVDQELNPLPVSRAPSAPTVTKTRSEKAKDLREQLAKGVDQFQAESIGS